MWTDHKFSKEFFPGHLMDRSLDEKAWYLDISLGMEDGAIPNEKITASSWTTENPPHRARLDSNYLGGGAWCPSKAVGSYLQIDLGTLHHVTALATQGNPSGVEDYVMEYTIKHSQDGYNWNCYEEGGKIKVFSGNSNNTEIKVNLMRENLLTRFLRVFPKRWKLRPCMRLEIFGRPSCEAWRRTSFS